MTSLNRIADGLNESRIPAARGGQMGAVQVFNSDMAHPLQSLFQSVKLSSPSAAACASRSLWRRHPHGEATAADRALKQGSSGFPSSQLGLDCLRGRSAADVYGQKTSRIIRLRAITVIGLTRAAGVVCPGDCALKTTSVLTASRVDWISRRPVL
jgi:hypothetical protein